MASAEYHCKSTGSTRLCEANDLDSFVVSVDHCPHYQAGKMGGTFAMVYGAERRQNLGLRVDLDPVNEKETQLIRVLLSGVAHLGI